MNERIISKMGLIETDINIGESFKYGIKVYKHEKSGYFFAKCDTIGCPSKNILCYNIITLPKFIRISEELLIKSSIEEINNLINSWTLKTDSNA